MCGVLAGLTFLHLPIDIGFGTGIVIVIAARCRDWAMNLAIKVDPLPMPAATAIPIPTPRMASFGSSVGEVSVVSCGRGQLLRFLEPSIQGSSVDAQNVGCAGDVALAGIQNLLDVALLHLRERGPGAVVQSRG
jgi:hypothetical protein